MVKNVNQYGPCTNPSSIRCIASADGTRGGFGMVVMSPAMVTMKPAPAERHTAPILKKQLRRRFNAFQPNKYQNQTNYSLIAQ